MADDSKLLIKNILGTYRVNGLFSVVPIRPDYVDNSFLTKHLFKKDMKENVNNNYLSFKCLLKSCLMKKLFSKVSFFKMKIFRGPLGTNGLRGLLGGKLCAPYAAVTFFLALCRVSGVFVITRRMAELQVFSQRGQRGGALLAL